MNKFIKIFMTTATICLILAGCSKNEVTNLNSQNPDVISFSSTTSRASINTLGSIQNDVSGFEVYATSPATPTTWYTGVNGTENYRFFSTPNPNWGWVSAGNPIWPTTTAGYPMNFYAMYPNDGAAPFAHPNIQRAITIAALAANQTDHLAAREIGVAGKPSDGRLSLTFEHILSKVNFGIIPGFDKTVIVQEAGVQNVHSVNTYNYVAGTWGPTTATDADYDYYKETALATKSFGPGTDDTEVAATPFYTLPHSNHLMLMPQTHGTWAVPTIPPATYAGDIATESYASLTYRLTDVATGDKIGYTAAGDYLVDYPTVLATDYIWASYTGIGAAGGGTPYLGELFIKAGFPFAASDFTWARGKGYIYNIGLGTAGSCNGYYTETTYFDEDGIDTTIPIIGPKGTQVEVGDPVTDGIIHFKVFVTNWDDTTTPIVLP